jgi:leader peptidase (prepilin peptidase) / N-methyltransferase
MGCIEGRSFVGLGVPRLADFPPIFLASLAVALGLLFGSFLNVVIHRVPRGESIVWPGSRCPNCGQPIRALDNLPILSYLLLLGRSRCCRSRISARYPIIEGIGGLYALAIVQVQINALPVDTSIAVGLVWFLSSLALGLGLVASAFIDLTHLYLPDPITFGGIALGLVTVPLHRQMTFVDALLGGVVGFLIVWLPFDRLYRVIRGRVGMGLGDAKLVALAGVWFGWQGAVFALLAGAVQGTAILFAVVLAKGKLEEPEAVQRERANAERELAEAEGEERERIARAMAADPVLARPAAEGLLSLRVPFGPFLALAIIEYQLFGEAVILPLLSDSGIG